MKEKEVDIPNISLYVLLVYHFVPSVVRYFCELVLSDKTLWYAYIKAKHQPVLIENILRTRYSYNILC